MAEQVAEDVRLRSGGAGLRHNTRPLTISIFLSLMLLFAPGAIFVAALFVLRETNPRFSWLYSVDRFPWQFWGIAVCGIIATIGGVGDWLFHKVYVSVGPNEHHSHLMALSAGGVVFILMALASVINDPTVLLIPVIVALLITTVLICYDEFAFHIRRCKAFENMLHRLLVFGNCAAFLCWVHWLFVTKGA